MGGRQSKKQEICLERSVAKTLLTLDCHTGKSKEERATTMTLLDLSSEPVASSGDPDEESMQKSRAPNGSFRKIINSEGL